MPKQYKTVLKELTISRNNFQQNRARNRNEEKRFVKLIKKPKVSNHAFPFLKNVLL